MVQKFLSHPHLLIMEESANYFGEKKSKSPYTTTLLINPEPHVYVSSIQNESQFKLPTNSDDNQLEDDGLFKNLKGILIFAKIIGVMPYSGIFGKSSKDVIFRPRSITACFSYLIVAVLMFNSLMGIVQSIRSPKKNALEIANSIRATLYFIWACYIYITFIYRSQDFLKIFRAWESTHVVYTRKDVKLYRDVMIITGSIMISALLENSILHFEYFKEFDEINGKKYDDSSQRNMTTLEVYLWRSNDHWAKLLGYNWFFAILAFIQHKWSLYSWNYIDALIAVFARALYFRFKALYEVAEGVLLGPRDAWINNEVKESKHYRDPAAWLQIVHDHKSLYRLLEVLETFFSPLIFMSYFVNMFYLCLQLLEGFTFEATQNSIVHSIYAPWSFLHLMLRIFVISMACARINIYAHKIRDLFQECPVECYTTEISRVDRRVTCGPEIALSGLQCFFVRKPFILSMLSVVFTFEIVLLQCIPSDNTCPKK